MYHFRSTGKYKNIQLQLHSTLRELNVWVDTGNFDKIILNILSNAFKFTPEKGNIDITIRTGEDNTLPDPLKQYAEIIIADTGTGIDEQEKNISSNVSIRSVTANRIRKAEQE